MFTAVTTGPDEDEDGPETFSPRPHPDDRLWRHPAEIAALQAAHANAETLKVPAVNIERPKSKLPTSLFVTAGVVAAGAVALTIGALSMASPTSNPEAAAPSENTLSAVAAPSEVEVGAAGNATTEIAVERTTDGSESLAGRLHEQVATSLPRIQAATSFGMREGSGLFVTSDGYIATSAGLVVGAEYVLAWTEDGRRWPASVIALDPFSDIAVLEIDSDEWPSITLGTRGELRPGQYAFALDHADRTISFGEVISIDPSVVHIDQPSAMPGSAIVDDTGAVIAMVTSDGSNSTATPAWMIEQVALDLITSGSTSHAWLGLTADDAERGTNVVVEQVLAESPAEEAGVAPGDVVVSINGVPVTDAVMLWRHVHTSDPGEHAILGISRDGRDHTFTATLGEATE